ncbi:hypothetical protein BGX26_002762, partial [Mortierella sp. AD094]
MRRDIPTTAPSGNNPRLVDLPRPLNSLTYGNDQQDHMILAISKLVGEPWRNMPESELNHYAQLSKMAQQMYPVERPPYRPRKRRVNCPGPISEARNTVVANAVERPICRAPESISLGRNNK